MKYEVAQRLKQGGFPQEGKGHTVPHPDWQTLPQKEFETTMAYAPTLDELKTACGDGFHYLINKSGLTPWRAWSRGGHISGEGSTPEEAVARLWLALRKKV